MQVSQVSDSVTHAVLGKKETQEMGISDSAALMHIFSTALYTQPMLAAVREIICNGWDGHITAGKTDTPLEITINEQFVKIRDFGPGIPHEKIREIYGVFGNSTKRDDSTVTGGFGLGSKAPFAYTDNFEVINHHAGKKVVYRISKSSMERGGKPTIDTIVELPTTETGIQVSMNVKEANDVARFQKFVYEVLVFGEIRAKVNGEEVAVLPLSQSPTGYVITTDIGTLTNRINLRYGNVVYPIVHNEHYAEAYEYISHKIGRSLWYCACIIFQAPPDTVTIAPSREALILTDNTLATVKKILSAFQDDTEGKKAVGTSVVDQINRTIRNRKIRESKGFTNFHQLQEGLDLTAEVAVDIPRIKESPYAMTLRKAVIANQVWSRNKEDKSEQTMLLKLKHSIYKGTVDKQLGKAFLKAINQSNAIMKGLQQPFAGSSRRKIAKQKFRAAFDRYVMYPIIKASADAGGILKKDRMFFSHNQYGWGVTILNSAQYNVDSSETLLRFLNRRVLLTRSKKGMDEFFHNLRCKDPSKSMDGWIVYHLERKETHDENIQKMFQSLGYEVHTYTPITVPKSVDPNAPVKEKAPKKPPVKRKGYLSLKSAKTGSHYLLSHARDNCKPEEHIQEPVAWTQLRNKQESPNCIPNFSQELSKVVWKLFGDQVAVVTATQAEILTEKGVPELHKFVAQYVDDKLSSSPEFPRYLTFAQHLDKKGDRATGFDGVIRQALSHHELIDSLPVKLRFKLSAETQMLTSFYEDDGYYGFSKHLVKCHELGKKVKKSDQVDEMLRKVKSSPWAAFIHEDLVAQMLQKKAPGSPELEVPYEIVRNLFK